LRSHSLVTDPPGGERRHNGAGARAGFEIDEPAGMQYAYAGMAQAYEDGSPVLCITNGVPAACLGQRRYRGVHRKYSPDSRKLQAQGRVCGFL
jgi:hypothetical protein